MRFRRHRLGRIQQVRDWPGPDLGGLLISLCSADRAPDPAVLRDSGGFTWFYVDLVDDQGRGATLIWSWGLRWPDGATFSDPDGHPVRVEVSAVLDNGPFYQRYLLRGRCGSDEGYGIGENLVPNRVDTDLLRPLVRMRVHRTAGPNSMWLPLFSGDVEGRVRRLIGQRGGARV